MVGEKNCREIYSKWLAKDFQENKTYTIRAESFVEPLHTLEIINDSDFDIIKAETSNSGKNRILLLEILPKKGDNALQHVIKIMKDNNDHGILATLNEVLGMKPIPKIWGDVPPRNRCFISRENVAKNMHNVFYSISNLESIMFAISGFGGVGKSEEAVQFLYKNIEKYNHVFWIKSKNVQAEYSRIADHVKLIINDKTQLVNETKTWFVQNAPCLLIFDDAESVEQIESAFPQNSCHILITSRNGYWPSNRMQSIELSIFLEEQSTLYIRKSLENSKVPTSDDELNRLSSLLGHLPLALTLACSYISRCYFQISDYIEILEQQLKSNKPIGNADVLRSVFATLNITIEKLTPLAEQVLSICAYINQDAIPIFLLKKSMVHLKLIIDEEECGEFSKAMRSLVNFSTLSQSENQDVVSIHCLLQAALRHRYISEKNLKLAETAQCLLLSYPWEQFTTTSNLLEIRQLLPHLSEMLKRIELRNEKNLNEKIDSNLTMDLMKRNADALREIGLPKEESILLDKLLDMEIKQVGYNDKNVASTLVNLGNAYNLLGDAKKAKELYQRALVIQEEHFGPDHPEVASTLVNLGAAYSSLGDTKKAKELYERALVIQEEHFGPDHPEVAVTLGNLGNAHKSLGDMKKAKELYEWALVIKEEHFGPDHPQVASTLGNLGTAYKSLGNTKKAKELYERALVIKEELFGPDHPQVASTLVNLGNAYNLLGDAKKAKELYQRALVIKEEHFGPDHPKEASTLVNLGAAYSYLGDMKKAKELYERALVIQEKHFGPDHPEVAVTLGNLGAAYNSLGDTKKAKELYERALVIEEEHFGPDHPEVAVTLGNLGNAYDSLGDTKKAKELYERVLVIEEEHFGPDHPEVAGTLGNLGTAYDSLGDAKTATELIEKSFKIFSEHFGAEHSNTIWAKQWLQSKQNNVEEKLNVEEAEEKVHSNQKCCCSIS